MNPGSAQPESPGVAAVSTLVSVSYGKRAYGGCAGSVKNVLARVGAAVSRSTSPGLLPLSSGTPPMGAPPTPFRQWGSAPRWAAEWLSVPMRGSATLSS